MLARSLFVLTFLVIFLAHQLKAINPAYYQERPHGAVVHLDNENERSGTLLKSNGDDEEDNDDDDDDYVFKRNKYTKFHLSPLWLSRRTRSNRMYGKPLWISRSGR